ncbi:MAG TPA: EamA family transporter RarD [Vicinamibacteria bacterium]
MRTRRAVGLAAALGAYSCWGFVPLYFKAISAASPLEVLSHRVAWSLLLLLVLVSRAGQLKDLRAVLSPGRTLAMLAAASVLIAVNWLVYIWAVVQGRVMEGSLGYFINPLVNVALGVAFLGEQLQRPVKIAVALAALGVGWLTVGLGHPPWISLALAFSFGSYGLLRKIVPVGAVLGLCVETLLLAPFALGTLAWLGVQGRLAFGSGDLRLDGLLILAGPITALPLLLFAAAARRLPLSTLGFVQYLSPTLQFLLAVLVFGEPLDAARAGAFVCIWLGLAVFTLYTLRAGWKRPLARG